MTKYLKPSGKIVSEEASAMDGVYSCPKSEALTKLTNVVNQCFKKNGSKYEFSFEIVNYLRLCKFIIIYQNVVQPILKEQKHRQLHIMGLNDISEKIISLNIATGGEIETLKKDLKKDLDDPDRWVGSYRFFQVVACKGNSPAQADNSFLPFSKKTE